MLIFDFFFLLKAALFAAGVYWCYEMLGRWRSDLDELRTGKDNMGKAVIVGLWVLTAVIAAFVSWFAVGLISSIFSGINGLR
jgi:hypothetical protein